MLVEGIFELPVKLMHLSGSYGLIIENVGHTEDKEKVKLAIIPTRGEPLLLHVPLAPNQLFFFPNPKKYAHFLHTSSPGQAISLITASCY